MHSQRTQTAPTASPVGFSRSPTPPPPPRPPTPVSPYSAAQPHSASSPPAVSSIPHPAAGVLANLQIGATLTITGRSANNGWFAAYLADGIAGWVPAAQVRVFGDANELEIVQESLGPAVVATLIAEASKPQAPVATLIARLTPALPPTLPRPSPSPPSPSPEITGPAVTVLVEGANLRAGPGTDFPIVAGLYQNESAALLGRNQTGDWLQIQLPRWPRLDLRPPRPNNRPHRRTPPHRPSPRPRTLAHPLTANSPAPNLSPSYEPNH